MHSYYQGYSATIVTYVIPEHKYMQAVCTKMATNCMQVVKKLDQKYFL